MNERFLAAYTKLVDPKLAITDGIEALKDAGDFSDDVLSAMEEALRGKKWLALTRLVHILCLCPSRKFTMFLCDLLDNHRDPAYMEAIADEFIDAPDERAVASISRAMDYHVWSDDDSHFNRKLIQALRHIGTEDAIAVIRQAAETGKPLVREDAEEVLRDLGRL